jgi:S-DNA-T family DNA segregation ATPase FtsK/SpoIIIE
MSLDDFNWTAAEADLTRVETIEPVNDGKADAAGVPVDDAARHAAWNAPTDTARRPILPAWARSRKALLDEAARAAKLTAYRCAFHGIRLPLYGGRLLAWAPVGAARVVGGVWRWASDAEGRQPRSDAVAGGDWQAYSSLVRLRDRHVRFRGFVTVAGLAATAAGGVVLALTAPAAAIGAGVGLVGLAGAAGRPADVPLVTRAVIKHQLRPLTAPMVERALASIGIPALRERGSLGFVSEIHRDGPGWRAELDLPAGTVATDIIDRRDRLASGLSRPLGCVWPEGVPEAHPGRLVLWVGDRDLAEADAVAWPLAKTGTVDLFEPFPVGVDPRGQEITADLMYTNWLIGSIPGMGKTFLAKLPLLAAGLDERAEAWVYEHKGSGDLAFAEKFATRYVSGFKDEHIAATVQGLRDLRAECERRADVLGRLPRDICPENKVTPELASRKDLGLHPLVMVVDECQELFSHEEHGKEAAQLAPKVVKLGRALGVALVLATQRPDKESLPTSLSSIMGTRACLRVMGQLENDMILGTSAYRQGHRATMFTGRDMGMFYFIGSGEPGIVKGAFVDAPTADGIGDRARALRIARGTLAGHAAGDTAAAEAPRHHLLDDLAAVWPAGEANVWSAVLVEALALLRPEVYGEWTEGDDADRTSRLTAALKPYGIQSKPVGRRIDGEQTTRRGISRAALDKARDRR